MDTMSPVESADNVIALFEDSVNTVPELSRTDTALDLTAVDTLSGSLDELAARAAAQIALLEAEATRLELESLEARATGGQLEPPPKILTDYDARVWLVWAKANGHQEGCLCARCPQARKRGSRVDAGSGDGCATE